MKKTLLAVALAAATTAAFADGHGVKLSGHTNYVGGDTEDFNGEEELFVGTAVSSESRFRLIASHEADNGVVYGMKQEFGLQGAGKDAINKRVNEVFAKGDFGKFTLGQGSQAGDGAAEKDFSGTYVTTGGAVWSARANVVGVTQVDGERVERLRYDSPKLGGIATLSLSAHDGGNTALALTGGTGNIKFGIFTESVDTESLGVKDEIGGSLAGQFGHFTAAVQFGEEDDVREYTKIILGYKTGAYSVAVMSHVSEWDESQVDVNADTIADTLSLGGESFLVAGAEVDALGLSFVYRPTKGVELYAGLTSVDVDSNNDPDGDSVIVGGRVKF